MKSTPLCLTLAAIALASLAGGATFPQPFNTEKAPGGPMPATQAAATVKMPPGFHCTVFAAEPDVQQPIAITTDPRGRLWVAENYTYAERPRGFAEELRDRIVILEDTDNDGHFDKRTVFWDGAQRLTSIEVGFGGVWALCLPNLVFIPDRNGDDVPDGPPQVVLDGFDLKANHNMANGLRWGPDGWLYGRQGILGHSLIGKPDAPADQRKLVNTGIWRFHPPTGRFEIVAEGTTNPWGMDWDAHGEGFFINTVIGHLWELIPGAHYRRMPGHGTDPTPRVYEPLEQYADHVHWASKEVWTDVRKGVTDATSATGGGHAHSGLLIYQGGQWPAEWNGRVLMVNYHGRRLNVDRLDRDGSGFVGRHEPDNFFFADPWFRGIDLIAAPDGGVFISDWSDTGECHDADGVHRLSGRVYKITYGDPRPRDVGDLGKLAGPELAKLQLSPNDWLARQSRRVLADRAAAGTSVSDAQTEFRRILKDEKNSVHRLRAFWGLFVSRAAVEEQISPLLADRDEYMRAWAVRLTVDNSGSGLSENRLAELTRLARSESSPLVRLALASALQRLPASQRTPVAAALLAVASDASDHSLPLMLWYGVEPIAAAPNGGFEKLLADARIPLVQRMGARRLAEEIDLAPARLNTLLELIAAKLPVAAQKAVVDGIAEGLVGRRKSQPPAAWDAFRTKLAIESDPQLKSRVRELSAIFGDGRAFDEIRAVALDKNAPTAERRQALDVLVDARAPQLEETCRTLLPVRGLTAAAAAGLALNNDAAVADMLLAQWPRVDRSERPAVMNVLLSRPGWATKVMRALDAGTVARTDISAFQVRQLRAFHDSALNSRIEAVWGKAPEDENKAAASLIGQWEARLKPEVVAQGNREKGRAVFRATCAACHTLYGEGGSIGPDLTGAGRENIGYLLENLLFPSAIVPDEYKLTNVTMKDGRVVAGMIRGRTDRMLRLQTITVQMAVPLDDIAKEETFPQSLMPSGLLQSLEFTQARDLIAYLMSKEPPAN